MSHARRGIGMHERLYLLESAALLARRHGLDDQTALAIGQALALDPDRTLARLETLLATQPARAEIGHDTPTATDKHKE